MRQAIIEQTCKEFGVAVDNALSHRRERKYAYTRHMISFLLREYTSLTLKEIGYVIGRHHSTIISSVSAAKDLIDTHPPFATSYQNITTRIGRKAA